MDGEKVNLRAQNLCVGQPKQGKKKQHSTKFIKTPIKE